MAIYVTANLVLLDVLLILLVLMIQIPSLIQLMLYWVVI
jgi:hypothetical protein